MNYFLNLKYYIEIICNRKKRSLSYEDNITRVCDNLTCLSRLVIKSYDMYAHTLQYYIEYLLKCYRLFFMCTMRIYK